MSTRSRDWRSHMDEHGDFELAAYIYKTINDLMKHALDMGTLLSSDPVRLRAYKEQIKHVFKGRWLEVAQALEAFDLIVPCGCPMDEYCSACGGSRYRINVALSPDRLHEVALVLGENENPEIRRKLQEGLQRALEETDSVPR